MAIAGFKPVKHANLANLRKRITRKRIIRNPLSGCNSWKARLDSNQGVSGSKPDAFGRFATSLLYGGGGRIQTYDSRVQSALPRHSASPLHWVEAGNRTPPHAVTAQRLPSSTPNWRPTEESNLDRGV